MSAQNLVRLTFFANKNPKLSDAEFTKHWAGHHSEICVPWLQRHGVVKYIQYHPNPELKAKITDMAVLTYDAMADFWYKSFEDYQKAYSDEYYLDVVKKDQEYLFDAKTLRVTVGVDICVIDGGKVVEEREKEF